MLFKPKLILITIFIIWSPVHLTPTEKNFKTTKLLHSLSSWLKNSKIDSKVKDFCALCLKKILLLRGSAEFFLLLLLNPEAWNLAGVYKIPIP